MGNTLQTRQRGPTRVLIYDLQKIDSMIRTYDDDYLAQKEHIKYAMMTVSSQGPDSIQYFYMSRRWEVRKCLYQIGL